MSHPPRGTVRSIVHAATSTRHLDLRHLGLIRHELDKLSCVILSQLKRNGFQGPLSPNPGKPQGGRNPAETYGSSRLRANRARPLSDREAFCFKTDYSD